MILNVIGLVLVSVFTATLAFLGLTPRWVKMVLILAMVCFWFVFLT